MTAPAWAPPDAKPALVLEFAEPQRWPTLNDRGHWSKNAPVIAYWRRLACARGQVAGSRISGGPRFTRVHVVLTLHWPDRRHRDLANWHAFAKPLVDGALVDAKLIPDDWHAHLVGPDIRLGAPGPKRAVLAVYDLGATR